MIKIFTTILFFTFFIGCANNYEIKEVGGKLYRINKRTGEIDLVSGQFLIRLKTGSFSEKVGMTTSGNRFTWEETTTGKERGNKATKEFDSLWNKYSTPAIGTIKDGYRFLGGNPSDSSQWVSIDDILDTMKWKPGEMKMVGKYQVKKNFPWDTITPDYSFDSKSKLFVKVH